LPAAAGALLCPGPALLELLLLLLHAASASAPSAAHAAIARGLRLFMNGTSPFA